MLVFERFDLVVYESVGVEAIHPCLLVLSELTDIVNKES